MQMSVYYRAGESAAVLHTGVSYVSVETAVEGGGRGRGVGVRVELKGDVRGRRKSIYERTFGRSGPKHV